MLGLISNMGRGSCVVAVLGVVLATSACTRTPFGSPAASNAGSLTPAPVARVNEGQLRPATPPPIPADGTTGQDGLRDSVDGNPPSSTEAPVEVARVDPAEGAKPVTRQAMVGAWTVSTGGSSCQIFLTLTKWSGGYRAASRGCSAASIADVQAWDVRGKQVVLVSSSGSTVATLYRSAEERYDGSIGGGSAISFSR